MGMHQQTAYFCGCASPGSLNTLLTFFYPRQLNALAWRSVPHSFRLFLVYCLLFSALVPYFVRVLLHYHSKHCLSRRTYFRETMSRGGRGSRVEIKNILKTLRILADSAVGYNVRQLQEPLQQQALRTVLGAGNVVRPFDENRHDGGADGR